MEEGRKKIIMIVIIVACLAAAGVIYFTTKSPGGGGGLEDLPRGTLIWLKCADEACGAEKQIDQKDYFLYMEEHHDPMAMELPPMPCEKCGKDSVYRAEKCGKCGLIFFWGAVPNDFADRCPKCKHSATEEARRQAREARKGKGER